MVGNNSLQCQGKAGFSTDGTEEELEVYDLCHSYPSYQLKGCKICSEHFDDVVGFLGWVAI